jgi:uncharacterized protein YdeI (YjbR/CyaY-like superfamily)
MKVGETLTVLTREQWRDWLAEHHDSRSDMWLVFFRKVSGKPTISYSDAVEVAICYGWIDSQGRRLDDERHATRFTPRRGRSHWSESNKERARRTLRSGQMTPAGLATLPDDVIAT